MIGSLGTIIDAIPLWLMPWAMAAAFFAAAQLGFFYHRRFGGKGTAEDEIQVLSTALLVLALLFGFTFAMGLGHYDERRQLVVQEANQLRTSWLRAGLVADPAGEALQRTLAEYAELRQISPLPEDMARLARAAALRERIWQQSVVAQAVASESVGAGLIDAVSLLIETGTSRERAVASSIPPTVLSLLVVFAVVASFLLGYVLATQGDRHPLVSIVLFLLMGLVIMLILELDRPGEGTVLVDQTAMRDVAARLARGVMPGQTP